MKEKKKKRIEVKIEFDFHWTTNMGIHFLTKLE